MPSADMLLSKSPQGRMSWRRENSGRMGGWEFLGHAETLTQPFEFSEAGQETQLYHLKKFALRTPWLEQLWHGAGRVKLRLLIIPEDLQDSEERPQLLSLWNFYSMSIFWHLQEEMFHQEEGHCIWETWKVVVLKWGGRSFEGRVWEEGESAVT